MSSQFLKIFIFICLHITACSNGESVNDSKNNSPGKQFEEFIPQPDNPKIIDLVKLVRQDSLTAYITKLAGFHTRHTNSDTLSDSVGIGAARRWVFNRFKQTSAATGGRLRVSYHTFNETILDVQGEHRNVVAELPGTVSPERKFVVSGHLDSRNSDIEATDNFAPGANDDGSGVAAVIELARVLSQFEFESTLIFVAVTGEEEGLFGSRAYAADLRARGENIVAMVTNDVIGNVVGGSGKVDSSSVRCFSDEPETSSNRQLARYIKLQGDAYVPNMTVNLIPARDRPGRGGDHFSFNAEEYTAARLTEPEDNMDHQHNMQDLPEFMSFSYLTKVTRVNAAYLASLADGPVAPEIAQVSVGADKTLRLTWTAKAAGITNFLLALRNPGETEYDRFYSVGEVNEVVLDVPQKFEDGVYVSIAAVDGEGNESIFSQEKKVE